MASIDANPPVLSRRVQFVLGSLCALLAIEALFFAPLNADAAFTLRQARAQAAGSLPCRDLFCEYTPLATSALALSGGALIPSMLMVQAVILLCAFLAGRLARKLGYEPAGARGVFLVTWALLLANEGRAIEIEPFSLACLLCAALSFTGSHQGWGAFRAGLWVAAAFWAKQYGLLGWVGLMAVCAIERRPRAALGLSAGVVVGVAAGFGALVAAGAEADALAGLFRSGAYPAFPLWANLATAPEMFGLFFLTVAAGAFEGAGRGARGSLLPICLAAASLLPFGFRGYRHYWHFAIPFLALLMFRSASHPESRWRNAARRAAFALALVSVALDVGRCVRHIQTMARLAQHASAERLVAMAGESRALYLVDPALLPLLNAPILAPREVGPKFTRYSRGQAEALLRAADLVAWDLAAVGADQPLRRLSSDPFGALSGEGFVLDHAEGSIRVYSRVRR